jgi:phage/plasmid-like protein (TIGR03299 family)
MSDEIHVVDGKASMAFTGPREAIWHGLGQELTPNSTIDEWRKEAGMDFTVEDSDIMFTVPNPEHGSLPIRKFPNRKALFRSDDHKPLSIVSHDFKVVQPGEVMEFFRDLVKLHGMTLSTAGVLFEGRRFWALAEIGAECEIVKGDRVQKHLLLTTAVDGSMATTAKVVATRVVCNNTLTMAMSEKSNTLARVTHKKIFDPAQVKLDLGIIDKKWKVMMDNLKGLANIKMNAKQTMDFFQEMYFDKNKLVHNQLPSVQRMVAKISDLAVTGSGSELSRGTAWGALNGATEYFTHGTGRRDQSNQFWESYHGQLNTQKMCVYDKLMDLVAA